MSRLTSRDLKKEIEAYARKALDSEYGVRIYSNNPDKVSARFYAIRAKLVEQGDHSLTELTVRFPASASNELWLIPKTILE